MQNMRNFATLTGRLTSDPDYNEQVGVVNFSIAQDNAGRESNETVSGFFDVTVWVKPSEYSAASFGSYIKSAIKDGTLAKGSLVEVIGRLSQERWIKDDKKNSKIVLIAENVSIQWSYVGQEKREEAKAAEASATTQVSSVAAGDSF